MNKKYDIVIIGSGLGALLCGAFMAKQGKRVCLLEKHFLIGGNLQVYKRKGCKFSAGMHYAGSLEKGQILHQIYSYLGIIDDFKVTKLDEDAFEKIIIGDNEYEYAQGMDNFKAKLISYFPEEKSAIEAYIQKLYDVWDAVNILNLRDLEFNEMPHFEEFKENAYDYIQSLTSNKELQALLAATNGLYAGVKEKTPLFIHANINHFFIRSAWRIAESGEGLANLLKDKIEDAGGAVLIRKNVVKLEFEGDSIVSALCEDGDRYYADTFISNAHPVQTMELVEPGKFRKAYTSRIKELQNSISTYALNIVLHKGKFKHINSNVYYSKTTNVWASEPYTDQSWPNGYMLYTTEDPQNKGFAESVVVLAMMNYEDVEQWEDTYIMERGEEYEAFKERKNKQLLDTVYTKFPELEECIRSVYSATPLTYRDYTGTHRGTMYGIVKDSNDPLKTFISPKTKIPNLLLTGQNINLHGMLGVMMTTFQTISILTDVNKILAEIRNY